MTLQPEAENAHPLCLHHGKCGKLRGPHDVHVQYDAGASILSTWWDDPIEGPRRLRENVQVGRLHWSSECRLSDLPGRRYRRVVLPLSCRSDSAWSLRDAPGGATLSAKERCGR